MHSGQIAALQRFQDAPLSVDREALVEPEVVGRGIGDEVPRPGVGHLVRDDVDHGAVAGEERRGKEGEARVLHPSVRKRRRQHEEVVSSPTVRAEERLRGLQHRLDAGQFRSGRVHQVRRGPDARSVREPPRLEVPDREADQVGRDRIGGGEAIGRLARAVRFPAERFGGDDGA